MSVQSAAYLYEPDPPFDASNFEVFFHNRRSRDESTEELPPDYVPDYPWLRRAAAQLYERLRPTYRVVPVGQGDMPVLIPPLPISANSPNSRMLKKIHLPSSEKEHNARLMLIEAKRLILAAKDGHDGYEWDELRPHFEGVKAAAKAFEKEVRPKPTGMLGRVIRLFED